MKMLPYPIYKNSGIDGIGEIPEHWEKSKIKYLADYINGYAFKPTDWSNEGKEIIRIENLNSNEAVGNRFPGKLDERYLVKKGDILLSWSASLGVHIWNREEGWLNQHIFKIIPKHQIIDNQYYIWLANWFITELVKDIHGSTMQHLTKDNFGKFVVYLPPFQEQNTIATFLDHNTTIIDELIARKEKQIELLKEKRNTLINNFITKGLDPDAPMKDSSIQWLGKIPKHWNIQHLKYTVKLIYDNVDELKTDLPYIGLEHIESWTGKLLTQEMQTIDGKSKTFRAGDVLFGKLRPYLAKVIRTTFNGQCTGELLVMRPKLIIQDYLFYYILSRSFIDIVDSSTYGAKMPRANWEFIGNLPILLPPETEQNTITKFLDREIEYIDSFVMKIQASIDKLLEYRMTLISVTVRGKIDVRKEVA